MLIHIYTPTVTTHTHTQRPAIITSTICVQVQVVSFTFQSFSVAKDNDRTIPNNMPTLKHTHTHSLTYTPLTSTCWTKRLSMNVLMTFLTWLVMESNCSDSTWGEYSPSATCITHTKEDTKLITISKGYLTISEKWLSWSDLLYVVGSLLHLLRRYDILVVVSMATNGPLKQIFQLSELSTHNRLA